MRKHGRVDNNQGEIVDALRAIGCSVKQLTMVGDGVPDLLVGYCKKNYLLEVKRPEELGNLTIAEVQFHLTWKGHVSIVTTVKEALAVVGATLQ